MRFALVLMVLAASTLAFAGNPEVSFDSSAATPRAVEESTVTAVIRDYSAAWGELARAVASNRRDLLDASFTGIARDGFAELIASQKKNGLSQRYVDHGHKLKAIFYSADGSALELHDQAQIEVELLDGSKVVSSQTGTVNYVVVLTPAENRWKIRVLQSMRE